MPEELLEFHAAAIPGTETVLRDELAELGFRSVRLNRGGIPFRGTRRDGWRACLTSRLAQRIQLLVTRFSAPTEGALYGGAQAVDWTRWIGPRHSLAIRAVSNGSALRHTGYIALKIKDAIVDQVRDATGRRPDVDREAPDLRVFVHLANDRAAIYLDLAGEPLHRRGYRTEAGAAPLRETLAAALLRLAGWDRGTPLIDPLCGSGTIAIEAAQWAAGRAPGLTRDRFGFERWADFTEADADALRAMRGELRGATVPRGARITAADLDEDVLDVARANARRAGVRLSFRTQDACTLQGDDRKAWLVTNPPFGQRLEAEPAFVQRFAATITGLHGWRVALLAGSPAYARHIPLHPTARHPLRNGDLPCEALIYDVP